MVEVQNVQGYSSTLENNCYFTHSFIPKFFALFQKNKLNDHFFLLCEVGNQYLSNPYFVFFCFFPQVY